MAILNPPFALGASGQVLSGRNLRVSLGAAFRSSTSGVQGISGVLYGPPNTMGELSLPSNTQLTVQPFRAVVQNTEDVTAGQYVVTNDAAVTLAVTAQNSTQFRRSLVVVEVDDSQTAGVASSSTTDRGRMYLSDGPLAATSGAAALPALPPNSLALGEILIPPTGQPVTFTPYNQRTTTRGGILPVLVDGSTLPGHDGAPGRYIGEPRDHPSYGLQRWDGTTWGPPAPTWASAAARTAAMPSPSGGLVTWLRDVKRAQVYDPDAGWLTVPAFIPTWCRSYIGGSTGQAIPAGTGPVTKVLLDTNADSGGGFGLNGSAGANNFTIPSWMGGRRWQISGQVSIQDGAAHRMFASIYVNGAEAMRGGDHTNRSTNNPADIDTSPLVAFRTPLTPGDVIDLRIFHDGAACTVLPGPIGTWLSVECVG